MALRIDRRVIAPDLLVGLTLAAVAIPEALGYSTIAGAPIVAGLYTLLLPLVVFAVLGASHRLIVGADSATASVVFAGLIGFGAIGLTPGSQLWAGTAAAIAVVTGVIVLLIRISGLGFVADFLSRTVLLGFLAGVGVQVALRQIPDLLGVEITRFSFFRDVASTVRGIRSTHAMTLVIGLVAIAIMLIATRISERVPGALIALVVTTLAVAIGHLVAHGVAVVGDVPRGLPVPALPDIPDGTWLTVLRVSGVCALVILAQGVATSRGFLDVDETSDIDRDLVGLGAANIAGGFTGAFPVNASPTKTAVSVESGGRSQWVGMTAAVITAIVLVAATGILSDVPKAALAGVVLVIGLRLVDVRSLRRLARLKPLEFGIAIATAMAVILLGVGAGVVIAIGVSILAHLRRGYAPHNVVMVKEDGEWTARPIAVGLRSDPGLVIYRFNGEMYFANVRRLVSDVETLLAASPGADPVHWFVLDAGAVVDIDYSAALEVADVFADLAERGITVCVAELQPGVTEAFTRYGLFDHVATEHRFATFPSARRAYLHQSASD